MRLPNVVEYLKTIMPHVQNVEFYCNIFTNSQLLPSVEKEWQTLSVKFINIEYKDMHESINFAIENMKDKNKPTIIIVETPGIFHQNLLNCEKLI